MVYFYYSSFDIVTVANIFIKSDTGNFFLQFSCMVLHVNEQIWLKKKSDRNIFRSLISVMILSLFLKIWSIFSLPACLPFRQ